MNSLHDVHETNIHEKPFLNDRNKNALIKF